MSLNGMVYSIKSQLLLILNKVVNYNKHPGQGMSDVVFFVITYKTTLYKLIIYLYKNPIYWQRQCYILYKRILVVFSLYSKRFDYNLTKSSYDTRFKNKYWHENIIFWFIQQLYINIESWVANLIAKSRLNSNDKSLCSLCSKFVFSSISPANIPILNPDVIQETILNKGSNIVSGTLSLLEDLNKWHGYINFNKNSPKFIVGENIASSKGKVIFKNDLLELIEYEPISTTLYSEPILIIPSWVNKYYIFDLQKRNSFVQHLIKKNHSVLMVSWVNPSLEHAHYNIDDYTNALIQCIRQINTWYIGNLHLSSYCLGGIIMSIVMSLNTQLKLGLNIKTGTFMASTLDYSNPSPIKSLMGEQQIEFYNKLYNNSKVWDGRRLATAINMLKPNDMIWSYWVNRYLKGKKMPVLDSLVWSADVTNMTNALFKLFSEDICLHNKLYNEQLYVLDEKVKINNISEPLYCLTMLDDHIAPWQGCITKSLNWDRVIVSEGGHFNGIINPINKSKFGHWDDPKKISEPEKIKTSWWEDWEHWISKLSNKNSNQLYKTPNLYAAPGIYVKKKI